MAAKDRTAEFSNAIRSFQSRNIARAVASKNIRQTKQIQNYSDFMMAARSAGKNIASTFMKLQKLTLLAQNRGLFDDRPQEIQELTYIIKNDLNALNQQIANLQELTNYQKSFANRNHLISHSTNMIIALQSKLASMSTDFKHILEIRTENMKQQKSRRDQFGQQAYTLNSASQVKKTPNFLLFEEDTTNEENTSLLQAQQHVVHSDTFVRQRAETIQNIESTIVELGGIFHQLAHMVKEQEEVVERIDTNIENVDINIGAAHSELLKYFQSISKNRWMTIKIFSILIFFFIIFVLFLT